MQALRVLAVATSVMVLTIALPAPAAARAEPTASPTATTSPRLLATLSDPGGQSSDDFGWAVATSGSAALVGSPGVMTGAGEAYIYARSTGNTWLSQPAATLHDPPNQLYDNFGAAVAISGTTAMVGARGYGNGAVYVYVRTSSGWPTTPSATFSAPAGAAMFGDTVKLSGTTAVVGARRTNSDAGSAYIFTQTVGVWQTTPAATLVDPSATAYDGFGGSVAVSGSTVVVSASNAGGPHGVGARPGAAYIYTRSRGSWPTTPTATLNDPGGLTSDSFGSSVAASETTVAVGAPGGPQSGLTSGAAYFYTASGGVWPNSPSATLTGQYPGSRFGNSVAVTKTMAVVGQPWTDCAQCNAGVAYVYDASNGVWGTSPSATMPGPTPQGYFGGHVAAHGHTMVISAQGSSWAPSPVGQAYIYGI